MGLLKKIKSGLGHIFDFRVDRWVDLRYLKKSSDYYLQETKRLFTLQKAEHDENFAEAAERLTLSEKELDEQAKRYAYMAVLFLGIGLLFLIYGTLLVIWKNWMGSIISFSMTLYAFALAFRAHFWFFQISQKRLGCTASEWFQFFVKRTRNPK